MALSEMNLGAPRCGSEADQGLTLPGATTAIAKGLAKDGTSTTRGGVRWYPAMVKKILESKVRANLS